MDHTFQELGMINNNIFQVLYWVYIHTYSLTSTPSQAATYNITTKERLSSDARERHTFF